MYKVLRKSTKTIRTNTLAQEGSKKKINMQKVDVLVYPSNEQSKTQIKKTVLFVITSKRTKYQGINLTKEM
jgi:hypothetical protein